MFLKIVNFHGLLFDCLVCCLLKICDFYEVTVIFLVNFIIAFFNMTIVLLPASKENVLAVV